MPFSTSIGFWGTVASPARMPLRRKPAVRLHSRVVAIPDVESESLASNIPVSNVSPIPFELENGKTDATQKPRVEVFSTEPDCFRTVGASTIDGRDFTEDDRPVSPAGLTSVVQLCRISITMNTTMATPVSTSQR
jgi:hypothetical protein